MMHFSSKSYDLLANISTGFIAFILALVIGFHEWSHVVIITGFLILQVYFIRKRQLHWSFFIINPFTIILFTLGSKYLLNLYSVFYWYDKVVHTATEFTLTLLAGQLLADTHLPELKRKPVLFLIVVTSIGITLGAIWEIAEWFLSFYRPPSAEYTATDTATDLIVDSLGALTAALLLYVFTFLQRSERR